jgi:hypothetical protein
MAASSVVVVLNALRPLGAASATTGTLAAASAPA